MAPSPTMKEKATLHSEPTRRRTQIPTILKIIIVLLMIFCITITQIEKNEMGGACGAYGGGERCAQVSGGETGGKETTGETQT